MRKICLPLTSVLLSALALGELAAQESYFSGAAVEGVQIRTNRQVAEYGWDDPATNFGTKYVLLPSSNLTVHLNAVTAISSSTRSTANAVSLVRARGMLSFYRLGSTGLSVARFSAALPFCSPRRRKPSSPV
jgi:hypothetical protein